MGLALELPPDPPPGIAAPNPFPGKLGIAGRVEGGIRGSGMGKKWEKGAGLVCSQEFPEKTKSLWIGNNGLEALGIKGGNFRVGIQAEAQDKINPG